MKKNLGTIDKIIRLMTAAILAILSFTGTVPGVPGIILTVLAVTLILTGFISFCPLYMPFKLSTIRKK